MLLELGYDWDGIGALAGRRGDPVTAARRGRCRCPTSASEPFWAAAAEHVLDGRPLLAVRHVLDPARRRLPALPQHRARLHLRAGQRPRRGAVVDRGAPVVPARLRRDLPFVLVDVELDEQAELRLIGRLLDGADAPLRSAPRRGRLRGPRARRLRPRVRRWRPHEPALRRRNQVAIVGYAQSPVERHADRAARRARRRHRAGGDRRRRARASTQVDGFVTGALFPTAGAHTDRGRRQHRRRRTGWPSTSASNPRYAAGFQGIGQIPGSVALAVNAIASGAADYVLVHRALHNPRAATTATRCARPRGSQQWTAPQGFFGPLAMIALPYNEYLQRYGATPGGHGGGGGRGPQERRADPVVVLARPAARPSTSTSPRRCSPTRSAGSTATSPSTAWPTFVLTSAERARDLPAPAGVRRRLRDGHADRRGGCRCTGRSTTSWTSASRPPAGCGSTPGSGPPTSTCRRSTTASRRSCGSGSRCSASARSARRTAFVAGRRHRQRRARRAAGAVRRRRARQRPHARRPADARVLPAARRAGRRAPAGAAPRSASPATPRRTSAAPSSTAAPDRPAEREPAPDPCGLPRSVIGRMTFYMS